VVRLYSIYLCICIKKKKTNPMECCNIQSKYEGHLYFTFGLVMKAQLPSFIAESNCIIYYDLYLSLSLLFSLSLPSLHLFLSLIPLKFMARGGGLSIDSDPIGSFFPHKPVVLNSFPEDNNISGQHKWKLGPNMDATVTRKRSPSSSPNTNTNTNTNTTSTIPFQVNLTSDNKRPHIDEMDFFPNKTDDDHNNTTNNFASASTAAPPSLDHLLHTHDQSSTLEVNVSHPFSPTKHVSCSITIASLLCI